MDQVRARSLIISLKRRDLRAQYEPAYVVKEIYKKAVAEQAEKVVIESIRNVGEAEFLKSVGAFLIAIDADQMLRYTRVQARRSATDQVDFLTFVEHEEREMRPVGPHDMDVRGVMKLGDATLENTATLKELQHSLDVALTKLGLT